MGGFQGEDGVQWTVPSKGTARVAEAVDPGDAVAMMEGMSSGT